MFNPMLRKEASHSARQVFLVSSNKLKAMGSNIA
jgi:hypothetical protein